MTNKCSVCGDSFPNIRANGAKCQKCHTRTKRAYHRIKAAKILGNKCVECGFTGHPGAFRFKYKSAETGEFWLKDFQDKSWEIFEAEIRKCNLVCANCIAIKVANRELKLEL